MKLSRILIALVSFVVLFASLATPAYVRGKFRARASITNSPPVAVDDGPYTVHGSALLTPGVMDNDSDPNGDAIFFDVILQLPSHGTLSFGQGDLIIYNAHNVYVGPDSFTYRIKDSLGLSAIGTVNINVVNQAPVAVNDLYVIRGTQQQQLFPSVLANDFDPDSE